MSKREVLVVFVGSLVILASFAAFTLRSDAQAEYEGCAVTESSSFRQWPDGDVVEESFLHVDC